MHPGEAEEHVCHVRVHRAGHRFETPKRAGGEAFSFFEPVTFPGGDGECVKADCFVDGVRPRCHYANRRHVSLWLEAMAPGLAPAFTLVLSFRPASVSL